jgi:hypothetical protein
MFFLLQQQLFQHPYVEDHHEPLIHYKHKRKLSQMFKRTFNKYK